MAGQTELLGQSILMCRGCWRRMAKKRIATRQREREREREKATRMNGGSGGLKLGLVKNK